MQPAVFSRRALAPPISGVARKGSDYVSRGSFCVVSVVFICETEVRLCISCPSELVLLLCICTVQVVGLSEG